MDKEIKKRTIMIFPEFKNIEKINEIRKKYDPLYNHVRPHISIVFTFDSEITTEELKNHLTKALKNEKKFKLCLQGLLKVDNSLGKYFFLNIEEGTDVIKRMCKKLYTGILELYKPAWLNENTFMPHMTVGTFETKEELEVASKDERIKNFNEKFETIVEKISVEIIDKNDDSIIEIEQELG